MDKSIVDYLNKEIGTIIRTRPADFGITVAEFAAVQHCSEGVARKYLNKAVRMKIMEKEQMIDGSGASPFVYFKKEK